MVPADGPPPGRDANVAALEQELGLALGMKVAVRHTGNSGGELAIRYRSLDQLQDVIERLKRPARR